MVGVLHQVKTGSRFTANSVDLMRRLSTSGMGIILVPEGIVADDLAAERLVRVLPPVAWQADAGPRADRNPSATGQDPALHRGSSRNAWARSDNELGWKARQRHSGPDPLISGR